MRLFSTNFKDYNHSVTAYPAGLDGIESGNQLLLGSALLFKL